MTIPATLLRAALLTACAMPALAGTKLLRYPDIHGDLLVFTYAGDLWVASTSGGTARRLTAHAGLEMAARFSPDGTMVAFTGQYDGDEQVYVVPTAGGEPRQLTFYPAMGPLPQRWGFDNQVYGWTPDGRAVVYKSSYNAFEAGEVQAYTVTLDAALPTPLPMPLSGALEFSPDGTQILYSPLSRDHRTWKKYEGGWAQDLHVFDLATNRGRNITNTKRTERDPVWLADGLYFASDRDGRLNLYRSSVTGDAVEKLTLHDDFDVKWAAGDGSHQIVYEHGGALRIYDARSKSDRAVEINVPNEALAARPTVRSVADDAQRATISADGKRVLVEARGDLYSVPADGRGVVRNLTQSSNAHEREASFAPDGKDVAYVSDVSGEEHLYVRSADGRGTVRKLSDDKLRARLYGPKWSPDGIRIAFSDHEGRLYIARADGSGVDQIANDGAGVLSDYNWSPKGRYLAYRLSEPTGFGVIRIHDTADGNSRAVTDPMFDSFAPTFSTDGQHLYFLSRRTYAPLISPEWNFAMDRQTGVYALTLKADGPSALPLRNSEAGGTAKQADSDADDDKKSKKGKKTEVETGIDYSGLIDRVTALPITADNYGGLSVSATHIYLGRSDAFYYGREGAFQPELVSFSFEERKTNSVISGVQGGAIAADGASAVVQLASGFKVVKLPDGKAEDLALSGLQARIDPRQEWAVAYEETWRRFRDHFYAANMHGYDWVALGAKYRELLPHVGHRSDLNYLLGELIGELNVSHAYKSGGDMGLPPRPSVALLGARFEVADGRYRITEVLAGDNEESIYRSPAQTVGAELKVGQYILSINGRELRASDNIYQALRAPAGQPVELVVHERPSFDGARTVLLEPIASESNLKYLRWVGKNHAYVTERSGGRLGYLHIPDMGPDGIREFIKWYYPQVRKQGLVIDVRGNGGGNVSQMLIERLNRKLLGMDYARGAEYPGTYPNVVFHGHLVCLISETSASDGDIFPYQFRNTGLGPLIGKRSWGGVVGVTSWGPTIDGGDMNVPQFGNAAADGRWAIEGEGVAPDIEVENDVYALIQGEDTQLDRAIDELLRKIETDPRPLPARPADPVKLIDNTR